MGELQAAGNVADGVDAPVGGAQLGADLDALAVVGDVGLFEVEPGDVRRPPGRHQQMRAVDLGRPVRARDVHAHAGLAAFFHALDLGLLEDGDAFGAKPGDDDRGQFGVVLAEGGKRLDDRDLRAQPAVRLRQFDADRPAADDDQMVRPPAVFEDCLVGEELDRVEAGNGRHHRRRSGRDDEAPRADLDVPGNDRARVLEARLGLDDMDAERGEALDGIVRRD